MSDDPLNELRDYLLDIGACSPAINWTRQMYLSDPEIGLQGLWDNCPHADWMLWYIVRTGMMIHEEIVAFVYEHLGINDQEVKERPSSKPEMEAFHTYLCRVRDGYDALRRANALSDVIFFQYLSDEKMMYLTDVLRRLCPIIEKLEVVEDE